MTKAAPPTQTSATSLHFRTTILTAGKTATGIQIPDEIIERLGAGRRPPVKITMNGYTYRSTVAVMGGRFMVGVNAENRERAKVAGGDSVDVIIAVDREVREVSVPPALEAVLKREAELKTAFEGLSYTKRRVIAESVAGAKTTETRQRRIEKAISELREAASKLL